MLHIYFTDASQTTHTCFTYTSHTLSLYFTHIAHALQIYVQHSLTKLHLSLLHIALHHIDITLTSPDFTRMGRSKGEQEKKKAQLCTFMLPEVTEHLFKPILSHLHAGLNLACSVASLSHPSLAIYQTIIMNLTP